MKWRPIPIMILALFAMPIVAVAILTLTGSFRVKQPKILGNVGKFSLMERQGTAVTDETLRGRVWVANFIFTSCSSQCPLLMLEAQKIQSALRFKEHFRLVSITVDPETDTPEKLRTYADSYKADPFKWLFLTGSFAEIKKLMQEGLKMPPDMDGVDLMHSSKFALVDGDARVRGYYDANDSAQLKQLLKDAKFLIKKSF